MYERGKPALTRNISMTFLRDVFCECVGLPAFVCTIRCRNCALHKGLRYYIRERANKSHSDKTKVHQKRGKVYNLGTVSRFEGK